MADEKTWGAMNEIVAAVGLHRIKDKFQKTYMARQCETLVANLDDAIDATLKQAPIREPGREDPIPRSGGRPSPVTSQVRWFYGQPFIPVVWFARLRQRIGTTGSGIHVRPKRFLMMRGPR